MKLQKHIKEIVITLSVISITAWAYATLSTVNTWDWLTATLWNNMVADVNSSTSKLANVTSDGSNVGIWVASPTKKLEVNWDVKVGWLWVSRWIDFWHTTDTTKSWQVWEIWGMSSDDFWIADEVNWWGTSRIAIKRTTGNVWIWTISPTEKLEVNGTVLAWNIRTPWSIVINNAAPTTFYQDTDSRSAMIHVNSNLFYILRWCGNNSTIWCQYNSTWPLYINLENNAAHFWWDVYWVSFNSSSDKRLKKNINTLNNSLENISKLRWVSFDWKSTWKKEIWLIAQEVEEVYPNVVDTDEKWMKSVKYSNLVAPLIESVKELKKENDELKKRIEALENK